MRPSVETTPGGRSGAGPALLWLLGSFVLLVPPLLGWLKEAPPQRLITPESPVDRTMWRYAEEWRFLQRARQFVPENASVIVRAETPQREVSLYMVTLGVMPRTRPIPAAYFDSPEEHGRRRAEYVLSWRCLPPRRAGLEQIAAFPEGCVFRDREAR